MADLERGIAERAQPAFEAAREAGSLERVADEVEAVGRLLHLDPRLRMPLADSTIPTEAKGGFLRAVLGDRVSPETVELFASLLDLGLDGHELVDAARDLAIRARLALADAEGVLPDVEDELFRLSRLVAGEAELRAALSDPRAPADRKRALLVDLLGGKANRRTIELVASVVGEELAGDLGVALEALAARAAATRDRVIARVRVAAPLDDAQRERLSQALSAATGKRVDIELEVDPTLIGGVVARVGDEVIDGSVRRRLEMARERLTT